MNERQVKLAARAARVRHLKPGVAHCDCGTCTLHEIPAHEQARILRDVRAIQAADRPYIVLAHFEDRVWQKGFRTLAEAKWSRSWALESGAHLATIRHQGGVPS
jgi:hypothetical protein